jgi:hypothetical protein
MQACPYQYQCPHGTRTQDCLYQKVVQEPADVVRSQRALLQPVVWNGDTGAA